MRRVVFVLVGGLGFDSVGVELERAVTTGVARIAAVVAEVVFLAVLLFLCRQFRLWGLDLSLTSLLGLGVMGLVSPVGGMFWLRILVLSKVLVLPFLLFPYFLSYLIAVQGIPKLGSVKDSILRRGIMSLILVHKVKEGS